MNSSDLTKLFRYKSERVSAVVQSVPDIKAAFDYVVDVCSQKEACTLLPAGCELELSQPAEELCSRKPVKVIAAPDLDSDLFKMLTTKCEAAGIDTLTAGLRNHLGGIDIGVTFAQFGIAETGTLVVDSTDEDLRLATMISEVHVALLPISRIVASAFDIETQLHEKMMDRGNYMAMITGASRTADIERVLALGVHGPLSLHIVLIEESHVQAA